MKPTKHLLDERGSYPTTGPARKVVDDIEQKIAELVRPLILKGYHPIEVEHVAHRAVTFQIVMAKVWQGVPKKHKNL